MFAAALYSIYGVVAGCILFFLLIEFAPSILNTIPIEEIWYYAQKREYVSDPALVFVYRQTDYVRRVTFVGDLLYSPNYGIPAEAVDYVATYDKDGFRINSSKSPYDIAVIGDSYIEFGESDEKTVTEMLKQETGLSVANFGRGWYGPYQYLEILKRHVLKLKPKFVVLAFFAGNDVNDIAQYEAWKAGGEYYSFRDLDKENLFSRFAMASGDTADYLKRQIRKLVTRTSEARPINSYLGIIKIGSQQVPMLFPRWERKITKPEIIALRSILSEFNALCHENQIIPLLVYIPTGTQVYADLYSTASNRQFVDRVRNNVGNPSLQAVASIATELRMDFIDLLPVFTEKGKDGILLYYPFDTHWNVKGRQVAASVIAAYWNKKGQ